MPRKSTGSTAIRSKKTAPATEVATGQPTPVQSGPDIVKNALATVVAASQTRVNTTQANLDEEIRRRAYELYLQRNGKAGDPNRDWFVAEREVRARHATAGHSA
jgi:Protein of unknown function (DUF2934)